MSCLMGIDLGTSAIKILVKNPDGTIAKARAAYASTTPEGWLSALKTAAAQLDLKNVDAIGLTSQVGTFIVDEKHVVHWNGPEGLSELTYIKSRFGRDTFIRHIGMAHPDMVSYPIPRLMHFAQAYPGFSRVCMPKELLIRALTGNYISDMYSWRGLADLENGVYSPFFMDYLHDKCGGFELPPLTAPTAPAGKITAEAARQFCIPEGIPVYTGCNDFFAALVGSGVRKPGDRFDITGTSEHLGGIANGLLDAENLISGRYFEGFVRYGVTASSGPSLGWGASLAKPTEVCAAEISTAPIFLPYVTGERCPVCDPVARGVMFGIGPDCSKEQMAYAVMEGVAFNLRQINESLSMPDTPITVSGGAALDPMLNQLKADILNTPLIAIDEPDASALGAAYLAGIGCGEYSDIAHLPNPKAIAEYAPSGDDHSARYAIFRRLYPSLKNSFDQFGRLNT